MYRVNLLPTKLLPESRIQRRRTFFFLMLYFFLIVAGCLFATYRCCLLKQQLSEVVQEKENLQPLLAHLHEVQEQQKKVEDDLALYSALRKESSSCQETLIKVFSSLPPDLKITEVEIACYDPNDNKSDYFSKKLTLRGSALSLQAYGTFLSELTVHKGHRIIEAQEIIRADEGFAFNVIIDLAQN